MVYVLNIDNEPLMPTERHGHVRKLLRDGRAVVVKRVPFTIKLTYETEDRKQPVSLGIDCGTAHIGVSACSEKMELFKAEIQLRTDIVDKLSTRRELRRTRRNRLRYRKARFDNRTSSKKEGWLAPSIRQKADSHEYIVSSLHRILPITEIHLEVGSFDAQKIKNPDIQGVGYQQGEQMGFWNVREYVLARDHHECQHCHGKSKDTILNVHHIESRKTGGNSPSNLVTLCETCHKAYHQGKIKLNLKRSFKSLRDSGVMNSFKDVIYNELKKKYGNVSKTYGYITKYNRIKYGVGKSHSDDARMISKMFGAIPMNKELKYIQLRRHNRQIYKAKFLKGGRLKRNIANHIVNGFRRGDVVDYQGTECYISGSSNGYFYIKDSEGNKLVKSMITGRKLRFKHASNGYVIINRKVPALHFGDFWR